MFATSDAESLSAPFAYQRDEPEKPRFRASNCRIDSQTAEHLRLSPRMPGQGEGDTRGNGETEARDQVTPTEQGHLRDSLGARVGTVAGTETI